MESESERVCGSPPSSPCSSDGGGNGSKSNTTSATTTTPSTMSETLGCQQATLEDEFIELVAYLAKEKPPKGVRYAFKRIYDAYTERIIANLVCYIAGVH
jgi:hypothetical protein